MIKLDAKKLYLLIRASFRILQEFFCQVVKLEKMIFLEIFILLNESHKIR
jgi:hypothetical protein